MKAVPPVKSAHRIIHAVSRAVLSTLMASALGELWLWGPSKQHRVLCGDATDGGGTSYGRTAAPASADVAQILGY